MLTPITRLVPLLGLLAACGSNSPHPANEPTQSTQDDHATTSAATTADAASTATTDASTVAAHETVDPCERLAREEAAATLGPGAPADLTVDHGMFGHCFPAQGPVRWAYVRLSAQARSSGVQGDDVDSYEGTFALARFDARGAKTTFVPVMGDDDQLAEGGASDVNYAEVVGDHRIEPQEPVVFDYNGDGEPEVIVRIEYDEHEGPSRTAASIYTFRNGHIELYAPAASLHFDEVADQDDDGRPDLLTYRPYVVQATSPGSGFDFTLTGPRFALHALPDGTFSATDAIAVRTATGSCPSRPARVQRMTDVACARVWGMSPADVQRMVRRDCRPPRGGDDAMAQLDGEDCRAQSPLALRWATLDPPVTLAAPAAAAAPRGRAGRRH